MDDLAPIVLFVYNRPEHTKRTLNALLENDLANESLLYIYADGPKTNADQSDLIKINEVRTICNDNYNSSFKRVRVVDRKVNYGLAKSIISGVTEILDKHDRVIVLEDDLITSSGFLQFLNSYLDAYENDKKVAGVSGYSYFDMDISDQSYLLPIGCSWGWGTWKRQWQTTNFDAPHLMNEINKRSLRSQFNFGNYPFFEMLEKQIVGEVNSWAIRFYASLFLNNQYFLFPKKSLVYNIGFDGSGIHTGKENEYFNSYLSKEDTIEAKAVNVNEYIINEVRRKFIEITSKKNKRQIFISNIKRILFGRP